MPTPCVPYDTLILPLRRDSTCCTRGCSLISRYEMNSSINTPTLWGFDIVRSQRHQTPGSYLSTFVALPASWQQWHTSKVEQKDIHLLPVQWLGHNLFPPFVCVCTGVTLQGNAGWGVCKRQ